MRLDALCRRDTALRVYDTARRSTAKCERLVYHADRMYLFARTAAGALRVFRHVETVKAPRSRRMFSAIDDAIAAQLVQQIERTVQSTSLSRSADLFLSHVELDDSVYAVFQLSAAAHDRPDFAPPAMRAANYNLAADAREQVLSVSVDEVQFAPIATDTGRPGRPVGAGATLERLRAQYRHYRGYRIIDRGQRVLAYNRGMCVDGQYFMELSYEADPHLKHVYRLHHRHEARDLLQSATPIEVRAVAGRPISVFWPIAERFHVGPRR